MRLSTVLKDPIIRFRNETLNPYAPITPLRIKESYEQHTFFTKIPCADQTTNQLISNIDNIH